MRAKVKVNNDGEPYSMTVEVRNGHTVDFAIDDGVAIARSIKAMENEPAAYLDALSRFMDFAETIPYIDDTRLAEYEGAEVLE